MTPILTKDAVIHTSEKGTVAHFRGAVKRPFYKEGEVNSDYFGFVGFGKIAEFLERFGKKNIKFEVIGYLKNSNFVNENGDTVYKDDIVIQEIDFAERKSSSTSIGESKTSTTDASDVFFNIDDDDDDDTPFK